MNLLISSKDYFTEVVRESLCQRKIEVVPRVETYLIELLEHYLDANNLFEPEHDENGQRRPQTLAEMYLLAGQMEMSARVEMLKKLGDRTLYISGFFGDSLNRKIVDLDYYADMGGAAYRDLAGCITDDTMAHVYQIFSRQFVEYVDVLTYISQKSLVQSNENILRLYDRYMKTGSELAREKLTEIGVLTLPIDQVKKARQF